MRRIRIEKAEPGMILARTVYTDDGKVLLSAGVELKERFIARLKEMGIPALYIEDEFGEYTIPDMVAEETRLRAIQALRNSINEVKLGKTLNLAAITSSVEAIINEVIANRNLLIHLSDIRSYDNYTFGHSVNVCILATVTGLTLGYNQGELRELATGAVLHDIGKIKVPHEILNKAGRLTDAEYEEVKKHTTYGYEILRTTGNLNLTTAHIAYQHHERINGTGYPRRLKGKEILEFAQLVGIADVYDALTADRIYQKGVPPAEAVRILRGLGPFQFEAYLLEKFLGNIAIYPVGAEVKLSSGESGIVVDVNKQFPARPVVRILYAADGKRLDSYYEVDLMKNEALKIVDLFSEPVAKVGAG